MDQNINNQIPVPKPPKFQKIEENQTVDSGLNKAEQSENITNQSIPPISEKDVKNAGYEIIKKAFLYSLPILFFTLLFAVSLGGITSDEKSEIMFFIIVPYLIYFLFINAYVLKNPVYKAFEMYFAFLFSFFTGTYLLIYMFSPSYHYWGSGGGMGSILPTLILVLIFLFSLIAAGFAIKEKLYRNLKKQGAQSLCLVRFLWKSSLKPLIILSLFILVSISAYYVFYFIAIKDIGEARFYLNRFASDKEIETVVAKYINIIKPEDCQSVPNSRLKYICLKMINKYNPLLIKLAVESHGAKFCNNIFMISDEYENQCKELIRCYLSPKELEKLYLPSCEMTPKVQEK